MKKNAQFKFFRFFYFLMYNKYHTQTLLHKFTAANYKCRRYNVVKYTSLDIQVRQFEANLPVLIQFVLFHSESKIRTVAFFILGKDVPENFAGKLVCYL